MSDFYRIKKLPPYVFNTVNSLKMKLRREGRDIIDFGMGNPDLPTPQFIIDKMKETVDDPKTHRYSMSRGIPRLRKAICDYYERNYNLVFDPESEAIVTIGSKEGLAHLLMAIIEPGDVVIAPSPTYPIHSFGTVIAGGHLLNLPMEQGPDLKKKFFESLKECYNRTWPKPRTLLVNFPHNPTSTCVDYDFFDHLVKFAKKRELMIIHDFAYSEIYYDGKRPMSIMEIPGAREVAVEMISCSKSYNMAGWRVGFIVGNKDMIAAVARLKSYMDYGIFSPIQVAAVMALDQGDAVAAENRKIYQARLDCLMESFSRIGWELERPAGTMFCWARIPEKFREMKSMEFCKMLMTEAEVAFSPGIGFGSLGDEYVRIALVENEHRIRQATRNLKKIFKES